MHLELSSKQAQKYTHSLHTVVDIQRDIIIEMQTSIHGIHGNHKTIAVWLLHNRKREK